MRKGVLFLNPRAGTITDESELRAAAEERGLRVVEVRPDVDVRAIVREALDAGMRTFVVAGGDGTVHHVAVNSYDVEQVGMVAPKTTFNDGRVSIYSLSFMSRLQFIRAAAKYFRGKIADVQGFRRIRTTQLRVDTARRRLRVSLDGELVEVQTPLQIAAVPASLLVRAPNPVQP